MKPKRIVKCMVIIIDYYYFFIPFFDTQYIHTVYVHTHIHTRLYMDLEKQGLKYKTKTYKQ